MRVSHDAGISPPVSEARGNNVSILANVYNLDIVPTATTSICHATRHKLGKNNMAVCRKPISIQDPDTQRCNSDRLFISAVIIITPGLRYLSPSLLSQQRLPRLASTSLLCQAAATAIDRVHNSRHVSKLPIYCTINCRIKPPLSQE